MTFFHSEHANRRLFCYAICPRVCLSQKVIGEISAKVSDGIKSATDAIFSIWERVLNTFDQVRNILGRRLDDDQSPRDLLSLKEILNQIGKGLPLHIRRDLLSMVREVESLQTLREEVEAKRQGMKEEMDSETERHASDRRQLMEFASHKRRSRLLEETQASTDCARDHPPLNLLKGSVSVSIPARLTAAITTASNIIHEQTVRTDLLLETGVKPKFLPVQIVRSIPIPVFPLIHLKYVFTVEISVPLNIYTSLYMDHSGTIAFFHLESDGGLLKIDFTQGGSVRIIQQPSFARSKLVLQAGNGNLIGSIDGSLGLEIDVRGVTSSLHAQVDLSMRYSPPAI